MGFEKFVYTSSNYRPAGKAPSLLFKRFSVLRRLSPGDIQTRSAAAIAEVRPVVIAVGMGEVYAASRG